MFFSYKSKDQNHIHIYNIAIVYVKTILTKDIDILRSFYKNEIYDVLKSPEVKK